MTRLLGRTLIPRGDRAAADVDALLEILRAGAQDRRVLAMRMGVTDRRMRRAVEEARRRGELVIWRDGLYRLAASAAEYGEWETRELRSRLGTFGEQMRRMRAARDRLWPLEQARWL